MVMIIISFTYMFRTANAYQSYVFYGDFVYSQSVEW